MSRPRIGLRHLANHPLAHYPWADAGRIAATVTLTLLAALLASRWAERALPYGQSEPVLGEVFQLTRGAIAGAAFNLLQGSPLVPWLSLAALAAVAAYLARVLRGRPASDIAVGLIFGGGLANLLDRLGDGLVTDYLDWGSARDATPRSISRLPRSSSASASPRYPCGVPQN